MFLPRAINLPPQKQPSLRRGLFFIEPTMNIRQKSFLRTCALFAAMVLPFLVLHPGQAKAGEDESILRQLRSKIAQQPSAVKKTAIPGLFGVYFNGADAPTQFVTRDVTLIGNSTVGYMHLTGPRAGADMAPDENRRFLLALLNDIPRDQLITYRYGSGERKVLLFTAYDCPSCRAVERELEKRAGEINATIYVIPLGLTYYSRNPAAVQIVKNIWCAQDPKRAWRSALLDRVLPAQRSCDRNPDDFIYLGFALPVRFPATVPTAVTFDGRVFQGVMRDFREIFG